MDRIAEVTRVTKETDIYIKINLDGSGKSKTKPAWFLDHSYEGFAKHGVFDLK